MKIALCFIINYEHILNKEHIWNEWIEPNKDIINVYFYYSDLQKIKSKWILEHTIPPNYKVETGYYHIIPAYISLMSFGLSHDKYNQWFCFLTDSCCPIISPKKFRYLFYEKYNKSIFSWRKAWWNPDYHKRANLHKLPENLRLANDAWFVLKREHITLCVQYVKNKRDIVKMICNGGLANESLFAIILYCYNQLNNKSLICSPSHAIDWNRMTSSTSPHSFIEANKKDIQFIEKTLTENKNIMFIRKVSPEFPDEVLNKYIYDYSRDSDSVLVLKDPFYMKRLWLNITDVFFTLFTIFIIIVLCDVINKLFL